MLDGIKRRASCTLMTSAMAKLCSRQEHTMSAQTLFTEEEVLGGLFGIFVQNSKA